MNKKHLKCTLWKCLWGVGMVSLLVALLSLQSGEALGLGTQIWFWNALVFAVLAIPIKLDCHSCDVCGIGPKA